MTDEIAQYKLDLDNDGDFDFNSFFRDKEKFFDVLSQNNNQNAININNNNNNNNNNSIKANKHKNRKIDPSKSKETCQPNTSNAADSVVDPAELYELVDRLEESDIDLTDHFNKSNSKRKILSNNNLKSKKLFHKNKSAEIGVLNTDEQAAAAAAPVMNQPRTTKEKRSKSKYDDKKGMHLIDDSLENINLIDTKVDCSLANDSIKTIFDSENEEIPLVGTSSKKSSSYHKKKSSHSSITLLNQKIKNQSTPPLKTANSSNNQQLASAVSTTNPTAAVTAVSTAFTSNSVDIVPRHVGEENEGFNETNF